MTNPFYDPGKERAARVSDLFGTIAPRYDLMNDLQSFGLHRWWKRRLIRLADPKPGEQALDVCCGTGDLAFEIARRGARVAGLDFSEGMLRVAEARSREREQNSRAVGFFRGDAQKIPFRDNSFEVVTVAYGLRNLASWETGLRELARVTKPGGRLLVLEFGKPPNGPWREVYFLYLRLFVPVLGRVFAGSAAAYSYILESLRHYPAQEGVAAKMRELNLQDIEVMNLLGGAMSIHYGRKPA